MSQTGYVASADGVKKTLADSAILAKYKSIIDKAIADKLGNFSFDNLTGEKIKVSEDNTNSIASTITDIYDILDTKITHPTTAAVKDTIVYNGFDWVPKKLLADSIEMSSIDNTTIATAIANKDSLPKNAEEGQLLKFSGGHPVWANPENTQYQLPVGAEQIGGVKNGGNVVIDEHGNMNIDLSNLNAVTYSFTSGDNNGQIKVTPSIGSAYNVSVKGLGSAAYEDSSNFLKAIPYGTTVTGIGNISSAGTATTVSRSDHVHALTSTNVTTALGYVPLKAEDISGKLDSSKIKFVTSAPTSVTSQNNGEIYFVYTT